MAMPRSGADQRSRTATTCLEWDGYGDSDD